MMIHWRWTDPTYWRLIHQWILKDSEPAELTAYRRKKKAA